VTADSSPDTVAAIQGGTVEPAKHRPGPPDVQVGDVTGPPEKQSMMPHNTFEQNGRVAGLAAVIVPTGLMRVVVRKTDLNERRASLPIGDRSSQS
jgi:hypothetical protein